MQFENVFLLGMTFIKTGKYFGTRIYHVVYKRHIMGHVSLQLDWTSNTSRQKSICQRTRGATINPRPP